MCEPRPSRSVERREGPLQSLRRAEPYDAATRAARASFAAWIFTCAARTVARFRRQHGGFLIVEARLRDGSPGARVSDDDEFDVDV